MAKNNQETATSTAAALESVKALKLVTKTVVVSKHLANGDSDLAAAGEMAEV